MDSENRVLLCLRNDFDIWNVPGGGVEDGEAPWEAVVREVREETGLNVAVEKLIGIYAKPDENDLVFSFKCKVISGNMQINEEAREIKYFHSHELPRNIPQKQVARIKDYLANNESVVMTKQYNEII